MHLIGENCLTYYQIKENEITKEYIGSNNFNSFFLEAAKQYEGNADFNEMKII